MAKFDVLHDVRNVANSEIQNSVGTFSNPKGVSCYANSLMQCLLDIISPYWINSVSQLKYISDNHRQCSLQSLAPLREMIAHGFHLDQSNCPAEFLSYLLDNRDFNILKPHFVVKTEDIYQCTNRI